MSAVPLIFVPLLVIVAMIAFTATAGRARSILNQWADSNGYQIYSLERRWVFLGPFFFRRGKNQIVYYVTLTDRTGHFRHAYIRIGGWFLGLLSDAVKVEWED